MITEVLFLLGTPLQRSVLHVLFIFDYEEVDFFIGKHIA